jgi:prephenate dehydrogenase
VSLLGDMTFTTFGIVGYGHLGELLAASFAEHGEVIVFDVDSQRLAALPGGVRVGTLPDAAACDVVIVAVPFTAFEGVLHELAGTISATTVVMDVISTKSEATALLRSTLGGHAELLSTHPLFGPPSMDRMRPGQRIVVTLCEGERAAGFATFLEREFGLEIVRIEPEQHDEVMAYIQALPFFIARALVRMKILERTDDALRIPSFEKLATLAEIEQHHTPAMFDTSQRSNPYAEGVRAEFLRVLEELQRELAADAPPPDSP